MSGTENVAASNEGRGSQRTASAGPATGLRLGVDVGGTFTDLLLLDEKNGRTFTAKVPSTPEAIPRSAC